ncbi:MAG TPA: DUF3857 and transglutaminase domain-containing protein [Calditrichia bacterium]|nr:DUF3857 and transglutaminase domain-containing protein [Calditrichia bacterium]
MFTRRILMICLCLSAFGAFAQDELPKFGKVDQEILAMTAIVEDPEADGVILFDDCDMEIGEDLRLNIRRRKRIKIFTENGKENYGTIVVRYHDDERVTNIKAETILPDGKKVKLNKKDIQEEEGNGWKSYIFPAPGLTPGAVIEYQYDLESKRLANLPAWYFQNEDFTMMSRLAVTVAPGYAYNVFFNNTPEIEAQEERVLRSNGVRFTKYSWTLNNLLPIREEPNMSSRQDYLATLSFQLIHYRDSYNFFRYIRSWSEVVKNLWEDRGYKDYLKKNSDVEKRVASLLSDSMNTQTKLRTLYNFVRDQIQFDQGYVLTTEENPGKVLKEGKGGVVEQNLLLVSMLRAAGFEAHPVLISTRSNGKFSFNQPNLRDFNRVLAFCIADRKPYVFDPAQGTSPYHLLPTFDLVEAGLLVEDLPEEQEPKFIRIPLPKTVNTQFAQTKGTIDPEGNLSAETHLRLDDYRGLFSRNKLNDFDTEEEYVRDLLQDRFGEVTIDSFKIGNAKAPDLPLEISLHYRVANFATVADDKMYLAAPNLQYYNENPFKRENRYFPVEYAYPISSTDDMILTLPDGYRIEELPAPVLGRDEGLAYQYEWKENAGKVTINRQFIRRQTVFEVKQYKDLRGFLDRIVDADQGQMVIARGASGAGDSPAEGSTPGN